MDSSVGANDVKKDNCVGRSSPLHQVQDIHQRQAGNSAHLAARRRSTLSAITACPFSLLWPTSTIPKRLSPRQVTKTSPTGRLLHIFLELLHPRAF